MISSTHPLVFPVATGYTANACCSRSPGAFRITSRDLIFGVTNGPTKSDLMFNVIYHLIHRCVDITCSYDIGTLLSGLKYIWVRDLRD